MHAQRSEERRASPRYTTQHRVQGAAGSAGEAFQGVMCDLSAGGCSLHLEAPLPKDSAVEATCDIHGLGLRLRGKVVWSESTTGGYLIGLQFTGRPSEQDLLFQEIVLRRLARQAGESPGLPGDPPTSHS